ncbi:MAG: CBS domain-containing protein [Gallionella sp.]|nr:CBS domain-containing protein [Gallionella sp.]
MQDTLHEIRGTGRAGDEAAEIELTDADILDAMRHISGYLDITTEDFRTIYHLAHRHALGRLLGDFTAGTLMRTGIQPLLAGMSLVEAAREMVRSGYKALPVVDAQGCVIGMLTERDFLQCFNVATFMELLLNARDSAFELTHRWHEMPVSAAMTSSVVAVSCYAGFGEVMEAFRRHDGRSLPVVNSDGRLQGLLLRKDFISAHHPENL